MAGITDPNYETVAAACDHCGVVCIFSRIDDIGDLMPISGRRVTCFACGKEFGINGDTINSAYRFLIDDATEHFRVKRYMPAIASLAQAWEVFFVACALSTYLYRPFFSSPPLGRDVHELNRLNRELNDAIGAFTWFPMRNLVMNMLLAEHRPNTLAEAQTHFANLSTFGNEISPRTIAALSDTRKRELLEAVNTLTVGNLRNKAVHKYAYRPKRSEVERCLTSEVDVLYRVKHRLGAGDFLEHQFDAVYVEE